MKHRNVIVHCPDSQTDASKIVPGSSSKVTFGSFSDAKRPHHRLNKNGLEGNNGKWTDPQGRKGLLAQNLHLQKMHLSESPRWWCVFVLGQPASRHMIHSGKTLPFQPDKRLQKAYFVLILSSNESEVRRKLMLTQVLYLHSVPTPSELQRVRPEKVSSHLSSSTFCHIIDLFQFESSFPVHMANIDKTNQWKYFLNWPIWFRSKIGNSIWHYLESNLIDLNSFRADQW